MNSADSAILRPDSLRWDSTERNETYQRLLSSNLSVSLASVLNSTSCLDTVADSIASAIFTAARAAGCAKPSRPPGAWWTPSVSAARGRCRLWHQMCVECGRPRLGAVCDCYHEARRSYRRARKTAARSRIDQEAKLLHTLHRSSLPSFWRHMGRVRRGDQPGQCALDPEVFRSHFSEIHDDRDAQLSFSRK